MMPQPNSAYLMPRERRSRSCADLTGKAAALWRQGLDTVEIAQTLNARHNCMLTEAEVASVIARWRDGGCHE